MPSTSKSVIFWLSNAAVLTWTRCIWLCMVKQTANFCIDPRPTTLQKVKKKDGAWYNINKGDDKLTITYVIKHYKFWVWHIKFQQLFCLHFSLETNIEHFRVYCFIRHTTHKSTQLKRIGFIYFKIVTCNRSFLKAIELFAHLLQPKKLEKQH